MFRRLPVLVLALLPLLAGCMHFREYDPKDPNPIRPADYVSDENKSCVYIFLIDPLDPFAGNGLNRLKDFAHELGFGKTYQGYSIHVNYFAEKIRMIRGCCGKHARFVIIGYDTGVEGARELASTVSAEGIPVALTIYLEPRGSHAGEGEEAALSSFTLRSVVPGEGKGKGVGRDEVATHPATMDLFERELTLVGLAVPPPYWPAGPKVLLLPAIPAPRETIPNPKPLPPEWQFLRPRKPGEGPPPIPPQPSETLPLPGVLPELPAPKPRG